MTPTGCRDGRVSLLIEAAMAFGTGHHGTTLGCLRALDRLLDDGFERRAGAGPRLRHGGAGDGGGAGLAGGTVLASDIDALAVEVAAANVAANGLDGRVALRRGGGAGSSADLAARAPFDLIFANILKGPLIDLAPDIAGAVAPGGFAILSGILNDTGR